MKNKLFAYIYFFFFGPIFFGFTTSLDLLIQKRDFYLDAWAANASDNNLSNFFVIYFYVNIKIYEKYIKIEKITTNYSQAQIFNASIKTALREVKKMFGILFKLFFYRFSAKKIYMQYIIPSHWFFRLLQSWVEMSTTKKLIITILVLVIVYLLTLVPPSVYKSIYFYILQPYFL